MLKDFVNLNKEKNPIDSSSFINLVFGFFPISFIFGNLITNINFLLFCILGIIHLKSKILTLKFNLPIKIIFLLFCLILFSTTLSFIKYFYLNGYEDVHLTRLIKSIIFFRFFLMLIIIYFLIELNILNFRYFVISATFASLVVALDVIYQYTFGFNIIGLKSEMHHNSGFFGDEWIAGGFIQNFSFFAILFITFTLKDKIKSRSILTTIIICIFGLGILFSGNKMPAILFLFGLLLLFLATNKLKKIIVVSLVLLFLSFKFFISSDQFIKNNFISIYSNAKGIVNALILYPLSEIVSGKENKSTDNSELTKNENQQLPLQTKKKFFIDDTKLHVRLFLTAIDVWKENKIIGNGIKSFIYDCFIFQKQDLRISGQALPIAPLDENAVYEYNFTQEYLETKKNRLCSNHPHNYYLEILTSTGIVGLFITLVIASLLIIFIFKNFSLFKKNNLDNIILLAAIISLILAVFPFKSSGSIFTTANTTYITIIASIVLSYARKLTKNKT